MSSAALATSVAAAFGHFSSFRRLAAWQHAVDSCALPDRLLAAQHYVAFVHERTARAGVLVSAMCSGAIPTSVSHNDAKIGNVLLKQSDHSFMCIIDFDTTMQGTPLYDFGDLCRTAVPGCEEDERELANIQLRMAMFRALTRGFIQGCGGRLTQAEAQLLCTAVWVITFGNRIQTRNPWWFYAHHFRGRRSLFHGLSQRRRLLHATAAESQLVIAAMVVVVLATRQ